MADTAHYLTDKELEKMEQHLSAIYSRAEKELQEKAEAYFKRFEELDAKKRALVDAGKMTEQEYKTWRQNKIMTGRHWTAMKEQAAQELLQANRTAQEYINGRLPGVYSLNYNSTGEAIEGAVSGYSFELVDASTVKNLATSDKTLLPYKYVDGKKDVRWNTAKVNSEVLQGIVQGESIPNIAKRLQNVTEMNRASAIRNARTTVTSAENKGRMDSLHAAAEKGVITHKIWLAAIDARTREAHRLLDGQEQDIDDPFESELGDIMFPGDPDADPANVYNCRCTLTYKVVGFGNRSVADEAESETVEEFIPATSIKEAEDYISQYVDKSMFGATGVDYTGVGLDAANEINRTFSNLMQTFDVPMFGGISAPAGNTKAGKMMSSATAAYSPIRKSYYLNRKAFKNVATANKAFQAEVSAINDVLLHPENYDFTRASSRLLRVIENSKISGRATIPTTIEQALQHEFGHSLERKVMSHELWGTALENMGSFAPTLSGYACQDTSEYIAESFCSFMQGEGKADPVLVKIFESFKR